MNYFVLLKKKVADGQFIVAFYKYKVSYTIPNDIYVKNTTYSSHEEGFFSSSDTYISVDHL